VANGEWGNGVNEAVIRSYRDLTVWQDAMTLAETAYRLTSGFPKDELYGMTSQMRRASVSIAANIAEGHGREHTRPFIQFLRIAQGSLKELETHLLLAERVGLLTPEQTAEPIAQCTSLGKRLRSLIRSLQERIGDTKD
jgi:four helix bundle protein